MIFYRPKFQHIKLFLISSILVKITMSLSTDCEIQEAEYSFFCFNGLSSISLLVRICSLELIILMSFQIFNLLPLYLSYVYAPKSQYVVMTLLYQFSLMLFTTQLLYWLMQVVGILNKLKNKEYFDDNCLNQLLNRRNCTIILLIFYFPVTWLPFNSLCSKVDCNQQNMNYIEIQFQFTIINVFNIMFAMIARFAWTGRLKNAFMSIKLESIAKESRFSSQDNLDIQSVTSGIVRKMWETA